MRNTLLHSVAAGVLLLSVNNAYSADVAPTADTSDLMNLSLQQLSDVEVTSVSKHAEKESQAAAAIYVITQEDIRRSGMQNIPDLLRMVPGLDVAQSGAQNWAVTSRGFNGQFANKLLVLIDGRTVYSPVFSGVYWDTQNLMLEDIDRIEVIRGPGATLWGANAVNGVINIITKSAKDTQGTLISTAVGTTGVTTAGRYGGTDGDLSYRSYVKYSDDYQLKTVANPSFGIMQGTDAHDQWDNTQGGFRMDWNKSAGDQITLQGDTYEGTENVQRFLPVTSSVNANLYKMIDDTDDVNGINILGRWKHDLWEGSDFTLQSYFDDTLRQSEYGLTSGHVQTFDFDFQHNLEVGDRNNITWGVGYRKIDTAMGDSFYISFNPQDYNNNLYSGFLQDKIALVPDDLSLTLGSKLEHNDFSGFEYEPSARLAWTPTETQTLWTAVSRAVRAPTESDQNINLVTTAVPNVPQTCGGVGPNTCIAGELGTAPVVSEDVMSYELGYRIQPKENLSFDVTGFFNKYTHLDSVAQGDPSLAYDAAMGYYIYVPYLNEFENSGDTHGLEFASTWEATSYWKLSGGYTLYYSELHVTGASEVTAQGNAPKQQFNVRSYVDLPHDVQWDTMLYTVDAIPELGVSGYARLDSRLGWSPMPGLDLSLIGQNLLQGEHQEYSAFLYQTPEEIGRSVIAKATIRF